MLACPVLKGHIELSIVVFFGALDTAKRPKSC